MRLMMYTDLGCVETCKEYCDDILAFFLMQCTAKHSMIYYQGNVEFTSARGFQQGDGLASMFPLTIFKLFEKKKEKNLKT